jgi:hypothetical protein
MERRRLLRSLAFGPLAAATPALAIEAARIKVTDLTVKVNRRGNWPAIPQPVLWGGAKQQYRKELEEVARSGHVRMGILAVRMAGRRHG